MNKRPRIAFSGPGGSGKTSLAHWLSQKLEIPYIHEVVRACCRELNISSIENLATQERIILQTCIALKQSSLEIEYYKSGFVSDRTLNDAIAYYRVFLGYSALYETISSSGPGYDVVFYVPPHSQEFHDDGFRLRDKSVETRVQEIMMSVPNIILLKGLSLEERKFEIFRHLERLGIS